PVAPISQVRFQVSRADTRNWQTFATDRTVPYAATLDTSAIEDGDVELRVVGVDELGGLLYSPPLLRLVGDNTPPTVTLRSPGSRLTGRVTVRANAVDNGSGIATVRFERAGAGTGTWVPFATARVAPFSVVFNTATVPNGRYDLRAVATDNAGHVVISVP